MDEGNIEQERIKRELLKTQMVHYIECVLLKAEREGNLDNIAISIHTDNSELKMSHKIINSKK